MEHTYKEDKEFATVALNLIINLNGPISISLFEKTVHCYYRALCKSKEINEESLSRTFNTNAPKAVIMFNKHFDIDDYSKSEEITFNKNTFSSDALKINEDGSDHEELKLPFLQAIKTP